MKKLTLLFVLAFILLACDKDDGITPVCNTVTNVSSISVTSNSAIITWNEFDASATYNLEFGVSGFTLGNGTTVSESGSSAQLNGLQPNTVYDVYIQTECSSNNLSAYTDVHSFTTSSPPVIPEFRNNLSELNLFSSNLNELNITSLAFEYNLNTTLFSDYASKQRIIALPEGASMTYDGDGLPVFPNNTVIAKTFYYNVNDRDLDLGKQIIETRVLIKLNGNWESGNYTWNDSQTDAILDLDGSVLPVSWIDNDGVTQSVNYKIPSNNDCFTCHQSFDELKPIGPKLRNMNFDINGSNQLQQFINNNQLSGIANPSSIGALPNWEDDTFSLEERARAYLAVNCASCHIPGGQCENESTLDFAYETLLENSDIVERKESIRFRVSDYNDGISMPFIGTSILHTEGVQLINDYLDTL
ncbi:fibronectin type III domain-containing protein [uncultured Winogradskyella sp.]|uniref:fibronectin type III domain-containing protein n=1 Tax=uncultured Winogradskyella sp. TaxID=395353 RepID=UPI002617589D|nr:fibronectin type III domain-containing protein [uncultured Winogradskyella sp.]